MRRRDFLLLSTLAVLLFTGSATFAQTAEKVYRVGVLAPEGMRAIASFRERLRQLGWIEGRNIRFDYRSAEGDDTRQPALATELVALPADLILTWGTPATLAAKQATATIPIVIGAIGDPVAVGAERPDIHHIGVADAVRQYARFADDTPLRPGEANPLAIRERTLQLLRRPAVVEVVCG